MNELRQFATWLWERPATKKASVRLPIPRIITQFVLYAGLLFVCYGLSEISGEAAQREHFNLFIKNGWNAVATGLFFFILLINSYLDEQSPSNKGIVAYFGGAKRDPKNPIVRLGYIVGICCLLSLFVAYFETWGWHR